MKAARAKVWSLPRRHESGGAPPAARTPCCGRGPPCRTPSAGVRCGSVSSCSRPRRATSPEVTSREATMRLPAASSTAPRTAPASASAVPRPGHPSQNVTDASPGGIAAPAGPRRSIPDSPGAAETMLPGRRLHERSDLLFEAGSRREVGRPGRSRPRDPRVPSDRPPGRCVPPRPTRRKSPLAVLPPPQPGAPGSTPPARIELQPQEGPALRVVAEPDPANPDVVEAREGE